jgi:putative membrane protein
MLVKQSCKSTCKRASMGVTFIAASFFWVGVAGAQQPGAMPGSAPPSQQQPMPAGPDTPSAGMPETGAPSQSLGDQIFVHDILEGNQAQMQMSQLAQQKSSSADIQQFSQKTVQVDTALTGQLQPAAKQLGVDEPKQPSKKQRQQIEKLQALSGADFDTAYLQAMARQQQHDLKEFKNEAGSGQSAGVQQAAKQDEPVLAEHYQVLEHLAEAHKVTLESAK